MIRTIFGQVKQYKRDALLSPLFAALDRICSAHNGLWSKEAEDYLLAHAPKLEIGEPKERIVERSPPC